MSGPFTELVGALEAALLNPPYDLILADPPWQYDFSRSDSRKIENQYPSMSIEELQSMRPFIDALHNGRAVLFMWATAPKLPQAIDLLGAWGFDYKTFDVWVKVPRDRHADQLALAPDLEPALREGAGMGYYTRVRHEPLLIATAGDFPCPEPARRPVSAFYAERRAHSEKPQLSYERIEAMYPQAKRLELFARARRPGWDAWGNEA
jgi:N6-adenosine-specific RNA methylase IME4